MHSPSDLLSLFQNLGLGGMPARGCASLTAQLAPGCVLSRRWSFCYTPPFPAKTTIDEKATKRSKDHKPGYAWPSGQRATLGKYPPKHAAAAGRQKMLFHDEYSITVNCKSNFVTSPNLFLDQFGTPETTGALFVCFCDFIRYMQNAEAKILYRNTAIHIDSFSAEGILYAA